MHRLSHGNALFVPGAPSRWSGGKRPVILHYHIYKNAGTTVEAVLEREFGVFFRTLEGRDANAALSSQDLLSLVELNRTLMAISSHQLRYPCPQHESLELFDICFIRHPLDRLFSQYSFLRKPDVADPLTGLARETDLAGFCSHLLEHHPEYARNAQTTLLLHNGDATAPSERDIVPIQVLVRRMAILGVVEAFDESLMLAEYTLHPWFPWVRLHYVPQNVTNSRESCFEQRLERMRARCGDELYARLLQANQLDMVLWSEARADLRRRLQARPSHEVWLEEFRRRTRRYQGGPRLRDRLVNRLRAVR